MSEPENMAVIEMRGVSVGAMRDIGFIVLEDMDWSLAPGEFWTVAGQQHSGKSDFLMLAAGLMAPVKGDCKLFGTETRTFSETKLAERLRVGFVFARGQLFNQLTIRENVALPLQYHRDLPPDAAAQAVQTLLELLELTPLADITPANVSANWLPTRGAGAGIDSQTGSVVAGQSAGRSRHAAPALVAAVSRPVVERTRLVWRPADDPGRDDGRFASLAERGSEICIVARQKIFSPWFVERSRIGKRPGRKRIAGRPAGDDNLKIMALQDLTPQLRTRLSRMERAVGWFVFLATALLLFGFGYYIYHTAERKGWFKIKAPFFTYVQSSAGLNVGDPVYMMGFPVGQITSIKPQKPYQPHNVRVDFEVRDDYFRYLWTGGSYLKVNAAGFLGNSGSWKSRAAQTATRWLSRSPSQF